MADRVRLWPDTPRQRWALLAILLAALALRLQVWRWHTFYPLGGDEREYFDQALTWLQGKGYHDLPLMRPPLYPVFLATVFQLFDSQVQRVRLVQAVISTAGVYLQWLLVRLALPGDRASGTAPLVAAGLVGLSYTLAANATELLTETTFLFGLCLVLCLLLAARRSNSRSLALLAGITTGLLTLVRSVALPLLPLGVFGLWASGVGGRGPGTIGISTPDPRPLAPAPRRWLPIILFVLGGVLTIAPWTVRNYLHYGQPILVDTTGAENLWLDNDPAGREAVKQQLYAMGEDRAGRQSVSMQRGIAVIRDNPGHFIKKIIGPNGEAQKLVALEYWDDMRERRAIWVPPWEVWARLILGDGIWVILAFAGSVGLWLLADRGLRWFLGGWALYIIATSLIFHVELRYRLPLYPILALGAAVLLTGDGRRWHATTSTLRVLGAAATFGLTLFLMLLHRPYPVEGVTLAVKHWHLWRGDGAGALRADPNSALARVALARNEIAACTRLDAGCPTAEATLREAIDAVREHPYAHLLLGALLRERGADDAARDELRYENASLEDLQRWLVQLFTPTSQTRIDIGDGLDLGYIEGFYPAADGHRWTTGVARIWLRRPTAPEQTLQLRLASTQPATVRVSIDGTEAARLDVGSAWQTYDVPLPDDLAAGGDERIVITLTSPTFRPRALDPTSGDNRDLGVQVDWVAVGQGGDS